MFPKVRNASYNSSTMLTKVFWHVLPFARARATFTSTYFRNIVRLAPVPPSSFLSIIRKYFEVLFGSNVGFMSTRLESFTNFLTSFFGNCSLSSSCKKSLFSNKLVSSVKTEWIRDILTDKELFSFKRFFRRVEFIYNLCREGVDSFKQNTLFNNFRTCEIVAPKVSRSWSAISTTRANVELTGIGVSDNIYVWSNHIVFIIIGREYCDAS